LLCINIDHKKDREDSKEKGIQRREQREGANAAGILFSSSFSPDASVSALRLLLLLLLLGRFPSSSSSFFLSFSLALGFRMCQRWSFAPLPRQGQITELGEEEEESAFSSSSSSSSSWMCIRLYVVSV
jgi:hypothetical protein